MRRRRAAFHSDPQEDFVKIAIECQEKDNMFYGNYGGNSAAKADNEQQENPEKKVEPEKSARARAKTMEIEDFNYVIDESSLDLSRRGANTTGKSSSAPIIHEATKECEADNESSSHKAEVPIRTINCLLVGAPGIGKHRIIRNSFPEPEMSDCEPLQLRLDLVIRRKDMGHKKIIYKFWIKELMNDSYESLIKLYYKQCSVFVFFYDLTRRSTFDKLLVEIERILGELNSRNKQTLLVATNLEKESQREVAHNEGVKIKEKYKLNYFVETSGTIEQETQQLVKQIDTLLSE